MRKQKAHIVLMVLVGLGLSWAFRTGYAQDAPPPRPPSLEETCYQEVTEEIQRFKNCQADNASSRNLEIKHINRQVQALLATNQRKLAEVSSQLEEMTKSQEGLRQEIQALKDERGQAQQQLEECAK